MLYFVRHGATNWNENKNELGEKDPKCQGRADIELNELGILQAQATAETLRDIKFDRIICSPLKRARQTCDIINKNNLPVEIDNRIIERDFGEFEGLPQSKFDFMGFWNAKNEVKCKNGETIQELTDRVYDLLDELEDSAKENILIVSHGGIGIIISTYFKGKPQDGDYMKYAIPNGKYLTFDFENPNF